MVHAGGLSLRPVYSIETTWGTATSSWLTIGQLQGTPTITQNNNILEVHAGGRINPRAIVEGPYDVTAAFDYYVQSGAFLIACIGSFDTTSPTGGSAPYTHLGGTEDSTSSATAPVEYETTPFTLQTGLELGATDRVLTVEGCKCNSVTVTHDMATPVQASVDIIGQKTVSSTAAQTVTEFAQGPWQFINTATLTLEGSNVADIENMSWTVNNDLKPKHGWIPADEKRALISLNQGWRKMPGTVTLNYDDDTELGLFFDDTASQTEPSDSTVEELEFIWDYSVGAGAAVVSYKTTLKAGKMTSIARTIPADGGQVTETFEAIWKEVELEYKDANAADPF